jgi:glutaredoxin
MPRFLFTPIRFTAAPRRSQSSRVCWSGLATVVAIALGMSGTLPGAVAQPSPTPSAASSPAILASTPVTAKPATAKPAVIALARHLKRIGAKMYGAYWCPHCHHQRETFGEATFTAYITYIECAEDGVNAQPALCRAKKIEGFPTWEIKGKLYPGTQSLEELANLSGYRGSRAF